MAPTPDPAAHYVTAAFSNATRATAATVLQDPPQLITTPASPALRAYYDQLRERVIAIRSGQIDPYSDNVVQVVSNARYAALDPWLVGLPPPPTIPPRSTGPAS
ncbi:hypothetical protein ACFQX6_67415 [Streptosporangium lutulentum]